MLPSRLEGRFLRCPARLRGRERGGRPRGKRFRKRLARHRLLCSRHSRSPFPHAYECPVESAIVLLRGGDKSAWRCRIRIVRDDPGGGVRCGAALRKAISRGRGRGFMRGGDDDIRSLSDKCFGSGETKAPASSSHDVDPVPQTEIHPCSLTQHRRDPEASEISPGRGVALQFEPGRATDRCMGQGDHPYHRRAEAPSWA